MKNKIIIAIDGHSSTGKSTLAKQLASYLGYVYIDTGAMYRAITLYAMQNHLIDNQHFDKGNLVQKLPNITLHFEFDETLGYGLMFLNNVNVEKEIRTLEVSTFVSKIAEISEVRAKMVEQQQEMGIQKGIVMDGRDIGTVVFPKAEIKIFMTASPEIRAKRRFDELQSKGQNVSYNEVLANVTERDFIDSNRTDSPLIQAKDAILIDNSNLTREEQFKKIVALVEERL